MTSNGGTMDAGDVLDKAAKIVETPGFWVQNSLYMECDGRITGVCAMGAIDFGVYGDRWIKMGIEDTTPEEDTLLDDAHEALERHLNGLTSIWNDEPGRTAAEVAQALRDAAAEWRIQHDGN